MFETVSLSNYRRFRKLELSGLGRVNLLVGVNNSGKTSVLEAVGLLASRGDLRRLWSTMSSRGEWLHHERETRRFEPGLALPYLFHGYQVDQGSSIDLRGERDGGASVSLRLTVKEPPSQRPSEWQRPRRWWRYQGDDEAIAEPVLACLEVSSGDDVEHMIPISEGWGIARDDLEQPGRRKPGKGELPVRIITTASMTPVELVELVDSIQLTDEESRVLAALRIVEPRITNFRPTVAKDLSGGISGRHGVILKLDGIDAVLPIGTLGDGSWRILGLALALAAAKGGVLLVDEIDTGLHYEVMAKMWRMVFDTAVRLDVQVFATSHSRDCYESLAAIAEPDAAAGRRITIQRIEPERGRAVSFTEQDIINAAERGIEVR